MVITPKNFPWDYVPEEVTTLWVVTWYPEYVPFESNGKPETRAASESKDEVLAWARKHAQSEEDTLARKALEFQDGNSMFWMWKDVSPEEGRRILEEGEIVPQFLALEEVRRNIERS